MDSNSRVKTRDTNPVHSKQTLFVVMSRTIHVISKEGTSVDLSEEVANTTKYLETVLKEDPSVTEITTNIPLNALEIAKKFCRLFRMDRLC